MSSGVEALIEVQQRAYRRAKAGIRSSWPEARALDADGVRALLEERTYCVLATAHADGRAHASPVAFSFEDGAFWVATVAGLRLRNLRERPWASLVVMDGERGGHRALTAEGPVELHEGAALDASRRRLDESWRNRHGSVPAWAAAFVELRPERVFSYASE